MSEKLGGWKKWLIILVTLLLVYTVAGFWIVPAIARGQIEKRGSEALDRTVSLEKVRMNPFTFRVRLENLTVSGKTLEKLASWTLLDVNFDPLVSLLKWQFYFKRIRVVDPVQWVRVDSEGTLNIADLLDATEDSTEDTEEEAKAIALPRVGVGIINIEGWALDFTDDSLPSPFHSAIGPMTFDLAGFTTEPNEESPYSLLGTTESGGSFNWTGSVSAQPPGSSGQVEFTGFTIPKYSPYAERFHNAVVRTGTVAFSTDYEMELGEELILRFLNARVAVENIQLSTEGVEDPEVKMGMFTMEVNEADAIKQTADIARIALSGIEVAAERREDGSINLLDWYKEDTAAEPETEEFPTITVGEISLTEATLRLTDQTTPQPAELRLDLVSLKAENAGSDFSKAVPVEVEITLNQTGTATLAGTVQPQPLFVSLDIDCQELALPPFQPYLAQFADVSLASGTVEAKGHVDASMTEEDAIHATWSGDAAINGIAVNGPAEDSLLFGLTSLELKGTAFQLDPLAMKADHVQITEPAANIRIDEGGNLNLLTAARIDQTPPEASTEAEAPEEAAGEATQSRTEQLPDGTSQRLPFDAEINTLAIQSGKFTFEDASVSGGFSTSADKFGGTIKGLSSDNAARADVDLSAILDGTAPVKVSGAINPFAEDLYTDLKIDLSNLSLPPFSPYSGKYIAQKIDKGSLSVDASYQLSNQDLIGENKLAMENFYLGEKVESPDALNLPVGLAVSLLRNREGNINLDVPVRGNLDDPQFKIGQVVTQVFGNIISKAATAPFALLGSILGGAAAELDLSFVDFAPGTAVLSEDGLKKVQLLDDALYERPALQLKIQSPLHPDLDREPLREARLRDRLLEERALSMPDAEPVGPDTPLSLDERTALLRSLFFRLFPEEAEAIAAAEAEESLQPVETAPEPEETRTSPPEEKKEEGFLSRMLRTVFGGKVTEEAGTPEPEPEPEPAVAEVREPAPEEPTAEAGQPEAPALPSATRMRNRIMDTITLTEEDFRKLSEARALAIQQAIMAGGRIEAERIGIAETATPPEDAKTTTEDARVFFGLN